METVPDHHQLLCDEISTISCPDLQHDHGLENLYSAGSFYSTKEDYEQAFRVWQEKEIYYMTEPSYLEFLRQNQNLVALRFRATQWFTKTRGRFNLSFGTVFLAANYLDRFISMNKSKKWNCCMVELLSIACLTIATKFSETDEEAPSFHEFLMEKDLEHSFEPRTIELMEMKVLETLKWRLASSTSYSYLELFMTCEIFHFFKPHLRHYLMILLKRFLLVSVSDWRLIIFRPSVVAVTALWCVLDEMDPETTKAYLPIATRLFNPHLKGEIVKCRRVLMEQRFSIINKNSPPSPDTVLVKERPPIYGFPVDQPPAAARSLKNLCDQDTFSFTDQPSLKKRKRDEQ